MGRIEEMHRCHRHRRNAHAPCMGHHRLRAPMGRRTAVMFHCGQHRRARPAQRLQCAHIAGHQKQARQIEAAGRPCGRTVPVGRSQMERRDQRAQLRIPLAVPRQYRAPPQLRADNRAHPRLARRLIKGNHTIQAVRVRERQRGHAVLHRPRHQLPRRGRARTHREMTMYLQMHHRRHHTAPPPSPVPAPIILYFCSVLRGNTISLAACRKCGEPQRTQLLRNWQRQQRHHGRRVA